MKAYRLEVILRGRGPELRRRILVPSELTFSQLALVLDLSIGWGTEWSSMYSLPDRDLVFTETEGVKRRGMYDAAYSYIADYIEETEGFVYLCFTEAGEKRYADVFLEKAVELWKGRAPEVLEWDGSYPAQKNKGAKGKKSPCSMAQANEYLASWCRIDRRRYDFRTKKEILEDVKAGKLGFFTRRRTGERAHMSPDSVVLGAVMKQGIADASDEERMPPTLALMLEGFPKDELLTMAEGKGLAARQGTRKQALIEMLANHMLQPAVLENYFVCLGDAELLTVQRFFADPDRFADKAGDSFEILSTAGYIAETLEGEAVMARETAEALLPLVAGTSPELYEKRRRRSWLLDCVLAANVLYGVTPLEVLVRLYGQGNVGKLSPEELRKELQAVPPEFRAGSLRRGKAFVAAGIDEEEIAVILDEQGDGDFYIPSTQEIPIFARGDGLTQAEDNEALYSFFEEELGYDEEETEDVMRRILWSFLAGAPVSFVRELLKGDGFLDGVKKEQDVMLRRLMNRMHDNTRSVANRGFTVNEIKERQREKRERKAQRKKTAQQKVVFLKDRNKGKSD